MSVKYNLSLYSDAFIFLTYKSQVVGIAHPTDECHLTNR